MKDYPIEKIMRDTLMCYHIDGTSDVHKIKIGEMLSGKKTAGYITD